MNVIDIQKMPFSEYLKLLKQDEDFELMRYSGRCFARLEDNFFELLRARGFENWEHLDQAFEHIPGAVPEFTERYWNITNEQGESIIVFDGESSGFMVYICEGSDEEVTKLVTLLQGGDTAYANSN